MKVWQIQSFGIQQLVLENVPEPRPGRGVGHHARTVVFPKHHQHAGPDEQPEQAQSRPESAPRPGFRNPFAVVRPVNVLVGDDNGAIQRAPIVRGVIVQRFRSG